MCGGIKIHTLFATFCKEHGYLTFNEALEYFSILGGAPERFDLFDSAETIALKQICRNVDTLRERISPSYLLMNPYRKVLMRLARGDGKAYAAMRKSGIGEETGEEIVDALIESNVLFREVSREAPLRIYPKQKLKKTLRTYRIQDKLRFVKPFYRFWFGFVEPFYDVLAQNECKAYAENFLSHRERLQTLVFEQLSNAFLLRHFASSDPIVSSGSYWDKHSEFDILAVTQSGKIILGECKYKERPVCKSELGKLQHKAQHSNIRADIFVLFSKSGFSNELKAMASETLLLFDADDMASLCYDEAGR